MRPTSTPDLSASDQLTVGSTQTERGVAGYWGELVTAALLGTDRRDPPVPPPGPIADVVDDAVRPDPASRMLAAVATTAAVRRAAFVPLPAAGGLQHPPHDDRSWCPPAASATLHTIVTQWRVLEDEWLLTVVQRGLRLPPDVVADLLLRHRNDAVRRARVALAAGPVAAWLTDQLPDLRPSTGNSPPVEAVTSLPDLAIPPDLAELLTVDAHTFAARLVPGFDDGEYGPAHRAVLVNLFARCRPAVLVDAAEILTSIGTGLAFTLADLARLRHRMLAELGALS